MHHIALNKNTNSINQFLIPFLYLCLNLSVSVPIFFTEKWHGLAHLQLDFLWSWLLHYFMWPKLWHRIPPHHLPRYRWPEPGLLLRFPWRWSVLLCWSLLQLLLLFARMDGWMWGSEFWMCSGAVVIHGHCWIWHIFLIMCVLGCFFFNVNYMIMIRWVLCFNIRKKDILFLNFEAYEHHRDILLSLYLMVNWY